uniref:Protein kinase domain-containing protein n=1 Tax=Timema poppense TaxID=170557 RepID=A0A7R9DBY6_TIMPO|nr:unnamed protein product [Timema poppensis]
MRPPKWSIFNHRNTCKQPNEPFSGLSGEDMPPGQMKSVEKCPSQEALESLPCYCSLITPLPRVEKWNCAELWKIWHPFRALTSFHSGREQCARAGMFVDKTSHTETEKRGTFDSNPDLPVIASLVQHESDALDHAVTESGNIENFILTCRYVTSKMPVMSYQGLSHHVNFDQLPEPGERFTLQELIGEGTYGEVFSARDARNNQRVAVKILENVADNIEEIEEEFLVLRDLSLHPNIPAFYGLFLRRGPSQEEDQLWFVMEVGPTQSVMDGSGPQVIGGWDSTTDPSGLWIHTSTPDSALNHEERMSLITGRFMNS